MKTLKNKKFFGVLGILDIVIIVFVLALVLPMIHYYIKFNEKGFVEQKNMERFIAQKLRNDIVNQTSWRTKMLDVDVSFKNLTESDLRKIRVGDKELMPDGTVSGEILWIGEPAADYFIVDAGTATDSIFIRTVPQDSTYSLPAKLRISGVVSDGGVFSHSDKTVKELAEFQFAARDYKAYFVVEIPSRNRREGI